MNDPPAPPRERRRRPRLALGCVGLLVVVGLLVWGLYAIGLIRIVGREAGAPADQARIGSDAAAVAAPEATGLIVPVVGVRRADLTQTWGDARGGGTRAHHGIDIMAAQGTPVIAAAPGTIEKLWQSEAGGTTLYVRSPQRRVTYYYAHLAGYAPGVREGLVVKAGDLLGYVGDTGNAGAGNYHLHFGITLTQPAQSWHEGVDLDPYPLLAGKPAAR